MSICGHLSRMGANHTPYRAPSKTDSDLVTIQGCSTAGPLGKRMRQAHLALPLHPEKVGAERKALCGFTVAPMSGWLQGTHFRACYGFAELGLSERICPVVFVARGNWCTTHTRAHSTFIRKQCLKERFDIYVLNTVWTPNWNHPLLGDG